MTEITISEINRRIGLTMTIRFIEETLGVVPARKEKRSAFFTEGNYQEVCLALSLHAGQAMNNWEASNAPEIDQSELFTPPIQGDSDDEEL